MDDAQPFYLALRALRDATPVPGAAVSEESWLRWLGALRLVFEAADRAWRSMDLALARVPAPRKSDSSGTSKGKGTGK